MSDLLYGSAREINNDLAAHSKMKVGEIIKHPEGYMVKVASGCFLDTTYGRVSNWWTWQRVLDSGELGEKESGYGW